MAAITAAVAVGLGTAYAANRQGAAAKKSANARGNAAQQAIDTYTGIHDQSRADAMPWLTAGQDALKQMQALNSGDFSSFYETPDYTYARDMGLQGLDRSAAARGRLYSGGADADRINFASGLASQNYNNFYQKLAQLSGGGQSQSQYLGQLGQNYGSQVGNALGIKGEAAAQRAAAGPMTQAGYGNALASAFGTYAGAGGGFGGGGGGGFAGMFGGGGGRQSGYGTLLEQQASTGPGSIYNFGDVSGIWGRG